MPSQENENGGADLEYYLNFYAVGVLWTGISDSLKAHADD